MKRARFSSSFLCCRKTFYVMYQMPFTWQPFSIFFSIFLLLCLTTRNDFILSSTYSHSLTHTMLQLDNRKLPLLSIYASYHHHLLLLASFHLQNYDDNDDDFIVYFLSFHARQNSKNCNFLYVWVFHFFVISTCHDINNYELNSIFLRVCILSYVRIVVWFMHCRQFFLYYLFPF